MAPSMQTSVSLRVVLLLSVIMGCIGITANIASSVEEINDWRKSFPKVPIPATLASHLSPLSAADVDLYAKQMADGSLVAASSHSFCMAAGLVCGNAFVDPTAGGHQSYNTESLSPDTFQKLAQDLERIDFFREKQLVKGGSLTLPKLLPVQQPPRKFLPHLLAQKFLLNHDTLPELFKTIDIPSKSNLSLHVNLTMSRCLMPPMLGEAKRCVSSLKEMTDFVASTMGADFLVLPDQDATPRQTAKLLDVSHLSSATSTTITCHDNMYPFQVYFCHSVANTKIYQLKVQLQDGSVVSKIATCHMDTSRWPKTHPAFAVLGTRPGESEACHYIIKNDLLLIPAAKAH